MRAGSFLRDGDRVRPVIANQATAAAAAIWTQTTAETVTP